MSQQDNKEMAKYFYRASAADFGKIPGSPLAYWVSLSTRKAFSEGIPFKEIGFPRVGMQTSNNDKYLRLWHEISHVEFVSSSIKSPKWIKYIKGGAFRRWYGNLDYVLRFNGTADYILSQKNATVLPLDFLEKPKGTWTDLTSGKFNARLAPSDSFHDISGHCFYPAAKNLSWLIAYANSKVFELCISIVNSSFHFQVGDVGKMPIVDFDTRALSESANKLIQASKSDWDDLITSWDFTRLPLLTLSPRPPALSTSYAQLRDRWQARIDEMQRLEEENNRLFIDAYGLQDELTPDVPLSEITLTCNPHYRYGGNLTDEEREARLQSDTLAELISYAIGCMMGRYSLDREGLVYAHAGNVGFKELVAEGAYATFAADDDGILPLTSEHWFADDVAARIEAFVRTVWGADTLEENLQFIADSLCLYAIKPVKKGGETARETIRRYLSTQFFKDHMKTYKKRPIYWLFSSGREKAFECLVYLHRYNEATLPRMRTEYVTPLLGQMASRIERLRLQKADASTAEAKRLDKEIDSLTKQLAELRAFDDQLKHHADMKITLDLDDGVKVNYGKFGTLLSDVKAITGDKGE